MDTRSRLGRFCPPVLTFCHHRPRPKGRGGGLRPRGGVPPPLSRCPRPSPSRVSMPSCKPLPLEASREPVSAVIGAPGRPSGSANSRASGLTCGTADLRLCQWTPCHRHGTVQYTSQHTLCGHASRVPGRGWRGVAPPPPSIPPPKVRAPAEFSGVKVDNAVISCWIGSTSISGMFIWLLVARGWAAGCDPCSRLPDGDT